MLPFTVKVNDHFFPCREHEDIFKALARTASVPLPRGCRNGGCGICKIRLVEGAVVVTGPQSRRHITLSDEFDRMMLGCRTVPKGDVCIELTGKLKNYLP
ncbi:2Fe-2S iron-sulfur cluster-binding protein [Simplicispira suum]|uniref:Ferredoxin n=1 Tax=Simplicispira suum TaxID=2109915 RepID=A0A2S0N5Z4_9BURK|nr:ferredoxin [Simplicispira suum]